MNSVSSNIKRLRKQHKMTQEALASKMFVTRQTVSNWENDKNQPDLETLVSLAAVFDTDINEIIYGTKQGSYVKYQKGYFLKMMSGIGIIAILLLSRVILAPYFRHVIEDTFSIPAVFMVYGGASNALISLFAAFSLLSALALWFDCRGKNGKRFAPVICLLLSPLALLLLAYLAYEIGLLPYGGMLNIWFYMNQYKLVAYLWMWVCPFVAGALIFNCV